VQLNITGTPWGSFHHKKTISKLNIKSIRNFNKKVVGKRNGKNIKSLYVEKKKVDIESKKSHKKPLLKNLAFQDLPIPDPRAIKHKKKIFKSLNIDNGKIKAFLKSAPQNFQSPTQVLSAIDETDVNINLEVPKGVPEDELNQHEQVFYSFQKRIVNAYINSFRKELNQFERKNPRLRFPLTKDKQKMAGRVIYDGNGDILKIQTLKWTNVDKLQGFFMDVLKNMSSLPNPPTEVLENEQFAINFVLTINN
jgi:hypothetical protein